MMNPQKTASGLGVFSLALGALEVLAAPWLCDTLGMTNRENLVRAFGGREIAAGLGILRAQQSNRSLAPWLWARVGGDALDSTVLGRALWPDNPKRGNVALAILLVSPVIALDIWCALELQKNRS